MTLGNMRAPTAFTRSMLSGFLLWPQGESPYGADIPVPAFGPRMICTACGAIGADAVELERTRAALFV